jgi:hypothetical protein
LGVVPVLLPRDPLDPAVPCGGTQWRFWEGVQVQS